MMREQRLSLANQIIRVIASHGRRFFSQDCDRDYALENPRISFFEFRGDEVNQDLWFIDKHQGVPIFTSYRRGPWGGFTEGKQMRELVKNLADYIIREDPIRAHFGPWEDSPFQDPWGYGDDEMQIVRAEIGKLILEASTETRSAPHHES